MSTKTIKDVAVQFKAVEPVNKTSSNLIKINPTPEEMIIDQQIRHLLTLSQKGSLTLEEVKILDMLIKNKRLCNHQSTLNAEFTSLPEDITDDKLMELAGSTDERTEEIRSDQDPVE